MVMRAVDKDNGLMDGWKGGWRYVWRYRMPLLHTVGGVERWLWQWQWWRGSYLHIELAVCRYSMGRREDIYLGRTVLCMSQNRRWPGWTGGLRSLFVKARDGGRERELLHTTDST